jgi:glycosyltransferase involved in cell wall biosynthesis
MRIAVFLTYGNSLEDWEYSGILERELSIYCEYQKRGHVVTLVSYGSSKDVLLGAKYGFHSVLINKWSLPTVIYGYVLPYIYGRFFRAVDLLKTNQLHGAHVAWAVSRKFDKPLVVRQGYSHYEFAIAANGADHLLTKRAKFYEMKYLRKATLSLVTSHEMVAGIIRRVGLHKSKVRVIPNFIIEDTWAPPHRPRDLLEKKLVIGFVGRLTKQKNLINLAHAVQGLGATIKLYGEGEQRDELQSICNELDIDITLHGNCPQREVAEGLRTCDVFVLPSIYEGHPKALIEAMALGIPVVASDSVGIRGLVQDGVTGILAAPDKVGLREGLLRMIDLSAEDRADMGDNARNWALQKYGLQKIVEQEIEILNPISKRSQ